MPSRLRRQTTAGLADEEFGSLPIVFSVSASTANTHQAHTVSSREWS